MCIRDSSGSGFESAISRVVNGEPKWVGPLWYVNEDQSSGSNKDGSPANPFREIQDAIDNVNPISRTDGLKDTVLVLPGTYDRADDQELYFKYTEGSNQGQPKNIVLKSRDGAATTILNGEGSKRLFEIVDGTDTSLQIIGFTISNGGENDDYGGAIKIVGQSSWDNSTNQNVTNYSGVTFRDCIISGTHLTTNGPNAPALYIERGHVRFINCKIKNNSNTAQNSETYGGVVRIESGSIVDFIGCELTDNAVSYTHLTLPTNREV